MKTESSKLVPIVGLQLEFAKAMRTHDGQIVIVKKDKREQ